MGAARVLIFGFAAGLVPIELLTLHRACFAFIAWTRPFYAGLRHKLNSRADLWC